MSPAPKPAASWTKYSTKENSGTKYNFNHDHSTLYDNYQEEDMVIDETADSSGSRVSVELV